MDQGWEGSAKDGLYYMNILPCLAFRSWTWSPPCGHSPFSPVGPAFSTASIFCFLVSPSKEAGLEFFQAWVKGVDSSIEAGSGWWAIGQAWKAAHFSAQVECLLLLCTDRPDCVDGRLSFIFYSHLKNMKEIYVTSPVDRKGQAVKGQVSNQLCWLFDSSFIIIIAFTVLLIIISEHRAWLFSSCLSLDFAFQWLNPE